MKKILHITNWYPNKWNDLDGIFIKRQFDVFSQVTNGDLAHVQVRKGNKLLSFKHLRYSDSEEGYYLFTKIKANKIIELLTTFLLMYVLLKKNYRQYDLLHFHIAYPLLIHYYIWKKFIKKPVVISEHWSAYHYNFYMPKETKKLNGIKRIFKQKISLITVSKALLRDIEHFSGEERQHCFAIIPNVISTDVFKCTNCNRGNSEKIFFTINNWRKIKNPFPFLEAFNMLSQHGYEYKLKIGGYGEMIESMKEYVRQNDLQKKILFLGKLYENEIKDELNNANAFLYSSKYETFSLVCAEALCCGTPLIGPKIEAIAEYADGNIYYIDINESKQWYNVLKNYISESNAVSYHKISDRYHKFFSKKKIQRLYLEFINDK